MILPSVIEKQKSVQIQHFFSCKIATIAEILKIKAKKSFKKSSQMLITS